MTDAERDIEELRRDPGAYGYRLTLARLAADAEPGSREELALANLLRALSRDEPS